MAFPPFIKGILEIRRNLIRVISDAESNCQLMYWCFYYKPSLGMNSDFLDKLMLGLLFYREQGQRQAKRRNRPSSYEAQLHWLLENKTQNKKLVLTFSGDMLVSALIRTSDSAVQWETESGNPLFSWVSNCCHRRCSMSIWLDSGPWKVKLPVESEGVGTLVQGTWKKGF